MDVLTTFIQVKESLMTQNVTLVAVSKTQSLEAIMERYELGQRIFGENRVQELTEKQIKLPKDIRWHQIGHLQTNKVRFIVPFVAMIHSGASLKLLKKISLEASKLDRTIDVLLQAKVAQEEAKSGFSPKELSNQQLLTTIADLPNLNICGLMGMASFTADKSQVLAEFASLRKIFVQLKGRNLFPEFRQLSMGMSGDYELAIQEGSTMVRIGSLIF